MSELHPDLPGLAALHPEAHDQVESVSLRLEEGARLLTYRTEGVIRGYLLWSPGAGGTAVIERLHVAPGWRRRGIAGRLRRRLAALTSEA